MKLRKAIAYAYATSNHAVELGHGKTGCYYVSQSARHARAYGAVSEAERIMVLLVDALDERSRALSGAALFARKGKIPNTGVVERWTELGNGA